MSGARTADHVVLVHGGWLGGWVWDQVLPRLVDAGLNPHAPTLLGLGDRATEGDSHTDISAQVEDLARIISALERPVTLLGHSYSGAVVTALADRTPDLVSHLIVLDGFVPEDGDRLLDLVDASDAAATIEAQGTNGGYRPAPDAATRWGMRDPEILALLAQRLTPQPGATSNERLHLSGTYTGRRTYISMKHGQKGHFAKTARRLEHDPDWLVLDYDGTHLDMLSNPERLASALVEVLD